MNEKRAFVGTMAFCGVVLVGFSAYWFWPEMSSVAAIPPASQPSATTTPAGSSVKPLESVSDVERWVLDELAKSKDTQLIESKFQSTYEPLKMAMTITGQVKSINAKKDGYWLVLSYFPTATESRMHITSSSAVMSDVSDADGKRIAVAGIGSYSSFRGTLQSVRIDYYESADRRYPSDVSITISFRDATLN